MSHRCAVHKQLLYEYHYACTALPGIEKMALSLSLVTTQLYRKTHSYQKPCQLYRGPAGRWETQLGLMNVSHSSSAFPPLMVDFYDMWGELYTVYWVLKNNSPENSVSVMRSCDTLVLTASSSSSSAASSPLFILPSERVSWTFLGSHYSSFLIRSMAFQSCFPPLPWAPLATSHEVQPPAWPSREPSDLSGLDPDAPPELT